MQMFKPGDVVRIKEDWLDVGEDPFTDYIVLEDLTDEVHPDGRVKVFVEDEYSAFSGYTYVYSYDMVYKVGHVDLEDKK